MSATTTNSIELTLSYDGTTFKRRYMINDVEISALPNVEAKILAYNTNIPAADKRVFISDDYDDSDPQNIIGTFKGISAARIITTTEERIN